MSYYKKVKLTLTEAIEQELSKGFDTKDEFNEVMKEISYEYGVPLSEVYGIAYSSEFEFDWITHG